MTFKLANEKALYRVNRTLLGDNKTVGEHVKAYQELEKVYNEAWERLDAANMVGVLVALGVFVAGLFYSDTWTVFLGTLLIACLVCVLSNFLNRNRRRLVHELGKKREKRMAQEAFRHLYDDADERDCRFLLFLSELPETMQVFALHDSPVYQPHVPNEMTYMWPYLLEKDGQQYQFAVKGNKKVVAYIIYPIDNQTGRLQDENIRTQFVKAD